MHIHELGSFGSELKLFKLRGQRRRKITWVKQAFQRFEGKYFPKESITCLSELDYDWLLSAQRAQLIKRV